MDHVVAKVFRFSIEIMSQLQDCAFEFRQITCFPNVRRVKRRNYLSASNQAQLARILLRILDLRDMLHREIESHMHIVAQYCPQDFDKFNDLAVRFETSYKRIVREVYTEAPDFVRGFSCAYLAAHS